MFSQIHACNLSQLSLVHGLVVRIRRSHRRGRGSIPRLGKNLFTHWLINLHHQCHKRGRYIYGRKAEKHKKSGGKPENGEKNLRKTGKRKCAGNRKMTFLSHGKPENLKIFVENGKLFFKPAETGKHFWKATENTQKTMKSDGEPENRKKATVRRKNIKFSAESRKLTPYNPPLP